MDAERMWASLRRDWYVVVAALVLALIGAVITNAVATKRYEAHAQLYVSDSSALGLDNGAYAGSLVQSRIVSYLQVAQSPLVAKAVASRLGLSIDPQDLASEITATAAPASTIIDLTVSDASPERARDIANAVSAVLDTVVTQVSGSSSLTGVRVHTTTLTPATTPQKASSPRPALNYLVAAVLGLIVGLLLALLRGALDQRIRTVDDLRGVSGAVPVLGSVPRRDREAGAESMRRIRAVLRAGGHEPTVVVVTGVGGGASSRDVATGLAESLAEDDVRVCLVDADLRAGGGGSDLGLAEVLEGGVQPADVLHAAPGAGRLQTIGPGGPTDTPSRLLGRPALEELVGALRDSFDRVVIAAPPLLDVADAAVLARTSDGVLLVVDLGRARRPDVREGLRSLQMLETPVVGTLASTRR